MTKDLLSIADLSAIEVEELIESARRMKSRGSKPILAGLALALVFEKPSLRTRVSFEMAMYQLGGRALYLSDVEVGLGKREPVADVARVLSRFVNAIAARTFSHATVEGLARHASVPVVNALSDYEHPCQALGDLLTIQEKKKAIKGVTIAYIGDGNNVANSLLLAACLAGANFRIASPPGYELQSPVLRLAKKAAAESGSEIECVTEPEKAAKGADVIYTDVWTSMGQEAEKQQRCRDFAGYQVNARLLGLAKKKAIFMHPLPAHHGEEVAEGIVDSPQSVVFDQAENRLHIQKAILAKLLSKP
ncbi:MAG: ornithine carbamoyltransferase [Dehalococcoidia bacterium]|nr:ornithine carbamoyltransferase [Dehalococcoidia bacterium]